MSRPTFFDPLPLYDASGEISTMRDDARNFAARFVAGIDAQISADECFPHHLWGELGNAGFLGITVPERFGGMPDEYGGGRYLTHFVVMEELSAASGSVGLSYIAHSNLCMNQIALNGTEEQKERFLPKLAAGEYVGALAMSEPQAGSDVISMRANAVLDGDHYVLNGTKMWITNGGTADVVVVYAKTNPAAKSKGITAFILEKGTPGFEVGQKIHKIGMRGSDTYELVFNDCRIPVENVLGTVNGGANVLMSGLNYERLLLSAGAVGLMQGAYDFAVDYTSQRQQFGRPVNHNQSIRHELADMYGKIATNRNLGYALAALADRGGKLTNEAAATLFKTAAEDGMDVTQRAVILCGGNGYTTEYPVGRKWEDAMLYMIGGGTVHIRRGIIADAVLGKIPGAGTPQGPAN